MGTLSARLERFDVTAPITFMLAGGSIWLAPLVGAALAPTDAALGAGMMANAVVPARIRRLINVESGLNDRIVTPFVSVALAGAATGGQVAEHGPAAAAAELAVGIVVGVAADGAGGLLVKAARRRGWAADGFAGAAVLGLAVCAYASAVAIHGNGFIAGFAGGLAFCTTGGRRGEPLVPLVEEPARWCPCWSGSRSARWPGLVPGGLASVVFPLLALEELGSLTAGRAVVVITVLLSVAAHGRTAGGPARSACSRSRTAPGGRTWCRSGPRVMISPFTFYRGAARIMAADLAGTPVAGLGVQLCGISAASRMHRLRVPPSVTRQLRASSPAHGWHVPVYFPAGGATRLTSITSSPRLLIRSISPARAPRSGSSARRVVVPGPMVTSQSSNSVRSVVPACPRNVISYVCPCTGLYLPGF